MKAPVKKKSGAAFRKEKQKRLLAAAGSNSTQPKLNFLEPASDLHGCIGSKIDETPGSSTCCEPNLNDECDDREQLQVEKDCNVSTIDETSEISTSYETTSCGDRETDKCTEPLTIEDSGSSDSTHKPYIQVDPFKIPERNHSSISIFLKSHPIHPSSCQLKYVFVRKDDNIPRKWLSYNTVNNKFYCSLCMAFGDLTGNFRNGICLDPKHATTRCTDHEKTDYNLRAAQAYIKHCGMMTVSSLLTNEQEKLRLTNVRRNREVMKRLINWILCIGRQGIAYRGDFESTKYFNDDSKNHGNFLEILRTASQQDELLKQHLDKCAKASQQEPDEKGPKGRGSKITFISKTTINKIIQEIGVQMKTKNVNEINSVDFYSIMVDITQDITGHEQCSIFVRYVNRTTQKIEERLIGVLRLMDTSAYSNLYRVYEYIMTLPCTQVACERCFSKLKIIKSRLRSAIKQCLLKALIFMNVERELTFALDVEDIINAIARNDNAKNDI